MDIASTPGLCTPDLPLIPSPKAQSNKGLLFLWCPPLVGLFLLPYPPAHALQIDCPLGEGPGKVSKETPPQPGSLPLLSTFLPPHSSGCAGEKAALDREFGSEPKFWVTLGSP